MISKATASEKYKEIGKPTIPVGPLPFLFGMGVGYLFFSAFSFIAEAIWGAGIVFGIILMIVLMHYSGMRFEFSEARLNKNRKEFNNHS